MAKKAVKQSEEEARKAHIERKLAKRAKKRKAREEKTGRYAEGKDVSPELEEKKKK